MSLTARTFHIYTLGCALLFGSRTSWSQERPPALKRNIYKNSIGMTFASIPKGTFLMGHQREGGMHRVTLSAFRMAQHEVTNVQFEQFKKRPRPVESKKDNEPVTRVSWNEANAFCRWLSKKEGRTYRLPTEAEWEYAARGELKGKDWPWGDGSPDGRANVFLPDLMPVGSYAPNNYGLYDMSGNVLEWVSDWYAPYPDAPQVNPKGPKKGDEKILRGGCFALVEASVWVRFHRYVDTKPNRAEFENISYIDASGIRVVLEEEVQNIKTKKTNRH